MLTAKFAQRVLTADDQETAPEWPSQWQLWEGTEARWLECNYKLVCKTHHLSTEVLSWILDNQPAISEEAYDLLINTLSYEQCARVLTIFVQGGIGDANA